MSCLVMDVYLKNISLKGRPLKPPKLCLILRSQGLIFYNDN